MKKAQDKSDVAEMGMMRWICGGTKLERIRNTKVRMITKVKETFKKVQKKEVKCVRTCEKRGMWVNLLDPEFLRASNICLDRSSYNGPYNKNG